MKTPNQIVEEIQRATAAFDHKAAALSHILGHTITTLLVDEVQARDARISALEKELQRLQAYIAKHELARAEGEQSQISNLKSALP